MKRSLAVALLLTCTCIVLALLSLLTSGCASVLDIQNHLNDLSRSAGDHRHAFRRDLDMGVCDGFHTHHYTGYTLIPLSASSIDFNFNLGVDNPNRISLPVSHLDFDLFADGTHLVSAISRERVTIPAHGYGEVPVRARVGYHEIRDVWSSIVDLITGNRAHYRLTGSAYYDTPIGERRFPVSVVTTR